MYSVTHQAGGAIALLKREFVPFGVALLIAESQYKFHSFTLECIAFLFTWYVVSWLVNSLVKFRSR